MSSSPSDLLTELLGQEEPTLAGLLAARAARTPEARMVWTPGRSWSYEEALQEVRRFAGFLKQRAQAHASNRVVTFLDNCPEAVWSWFGTSWAGAVHVPIHRAQRGSLLADQIERSGARLVVTDVDGVHVLERAGLTGMEYVLVDGCVSKSQPNETGQWTWDDVRGAAPMEGPCVSQDLAAVVFTSGTTGRSKAVRMSHTQCIRGGAAVAWAAELSGDDVFHCWWPLYHVAAMVDTTVPVLIAGSTLALYDGFSLSRFWGQVEESGATIFGGMANVLELLWARPESPDDDRNTLRAGVIGYIPPGLQGRFEARFGLRLLDTYGMTEVEPIALPHPGMAPPEGSCGKANPDLLVGVEDELGFVKTMAAEGEIVVRPRRPSVMFDGYENDAEETLKACRNLWFHTGDLGRIDVDGNITYIDRIKDVIRRRGENISTWELERAVVEHPDIEECAAVGVASPLGEDDVKVVIVLREGARLTADELREWCKPRIARFMLPRFIEIRESLPRNATGKVLRDDLRAVKGNCWDVEQCTRPEAKDTKQQAPAAMREA